MKQNKQQTGTVKKEASNSSKKIDNKTDGNAGSSAGDTKESYPEDKEVPTEKEELTEEVDNCSEKEIKLQEKLAEIQDKYIRLSAEFDNYRKRTLKEKMDLTKYASEGVLLKAIPLMDDFERAMAAMEKSNDAEAIRTGLVLICDKFAEFLKNSGIREIKAINCPLDVDVHDAVAKIPVDDETLKGKIVDVVQKGYYLNDKVIRHSKVVVGE
jgi:molecular chaperone GrpE